MRIRSLNRIRLYQEKEIMFMRNYSRLVNSMPICYMKQRILFDEKEYPTDYVILELNPALEALLKCDKNKYTILLQADRLLLQCFDHISEYPGLCGYFYG